MSEPFRMPLNASTRACAVFGHPVLHSASPAMQNAGIAALGLDWRYLAFDVHPDELAGALEGAKRMGFVGVNLTVPHKLLAVGMVDKLDASGQEWGAVNTVRLEGKNGKGEWRPLHEFKERPAEVRSHGFNTDADAITKSLREDLGLEVKGKTMLLLGAGGAGRTAALKLAAGEVGKLFLVNRTESRAIGLRDEIVQRYPGVQIAVGYPDPGQRVDLILNATSLGLKETDLLPLDTKRFPIDHSIAVYDMIYRPAETNLLQFAKTSGCRACNGVGMLLYQGAAALEIWSGRPAPIDVMRQALLKNIYS